MGLTKNIFLVDDDVDDQLFFTDALKEIDESIKCTIANNGRDAIVQLKNLEILPEILFLDLNMPFMNGYECLSQLKNELRLSKIPVVIFTTSNDPKDAEITHQLGAHVFLSKPNEFNQLRSKLERILNLDFNGSSKFISQYSV
ncbi:MAG: response regulator [Bacteroidota bacterium]